jgi:hypothetical protein
MYAHIVAGRSPADRRSKTMALIRFRPFPQVLDSSRDVMERAVTPPADMYETKDEVGP